MRSRLEERILGVSLLLRRLKNIDQGKKPGVPPKHDETEQSHQMKKKQNKTKRVPSPRETE